MSDKDATDTSQQNDKAIRAHLTWYYGAALVVFLILVAIIVVRFFDTDAFLSARIGFYLVMAGLFLAAGMIGPIISMSRCGHVVVARVCVLSGALVVIEMVIFYAAYFAFRGPEFLARPSNADAFDKILNLPPVIIAIWAAATGWYVAFQASHKNQRTANAFSIVLQTRTNTEFLRNQERVRKYFPIPSKLGDEHKAFFAAASLKPALERLTELKRDPNLDQAAMTEIKKEIALIRAVESCKYLLNFYEFMAVGIKSKDLDEDMLYKTISTSVVSLYRRAAKLTAYFKSEAGGSQTLVFQYLDKLVRKWETALQQEESEKNSS